MTSSLDFFLQWHLTERCNLACRHCYQAGRPGDELSAAEALAVVDEIAETVRAWRGEYGVDLAPSCHLTGGEPLLRKDLYDLLDALKREGFALFLLTNGTLIDAGTASRLAAGVAGVQVSLEGPEGVHEAIRGPGTFAAALRGVELLRQAGVTVTLNVTLSRLNADHVEGLAAVAANAGAARLGFARLVPSGRGRALADQALPAGEIDAVYRRLFALDLPGLEIVTGDPVAAQVNQPIRSSRTAALGGCAAGISGITLLPDGTLLPCRRLEIPIGNLRRDSLREVWVTSEVLRNLRDRRRYGGRCGGCPRWADCRGCRAVAWASTGDYLADDPQCFI